MKNKIVIISIFVAITLLVSLVAIYFIGSGFRKMTNVALLDYSVSQDGTEITLNTTVITSIGYTRGFKDSGGGVKPHYLTFYSTFGGINSQFGAKSEHKLELDKDDREIYIYSAGGGYELVLQKNKETGEWIRQ